MKEHSDEIPHNVNQIKVQARGMTSNPIIEHNANAEIDVIKVSINIYFSKYYQDLQRKRAIQISSGQQI